MKTPYKDIYSVLKLNRIVVLSVIIATTMVSVVAIIFVVRQHKYMTEHAFAISTEGSVIPLKMISQYENLEVEAMAHLELFHKYFYNLDANNYERQLEKALWLGNSTVDALYLQKKADGVYNRLLQYSLVQKVSSVNSTIHIQKSPYAFQTITVFEINRGAVIDRYELTTTGHIIHVDRNFPNNTHGLLITDFFEKTLRKLDSD
ncbi:conjugal transfer protein TraK [uncultured Formosa sp.]|uniref:conjugal transfer protein TraK n=1 Tax=uncultured Formosa sp. TaxID=255435 RepID=UPI0026378BB2|nr:conjugal transfer protein TraK [uncultured Formosa sp.]